MRKGIKRRFLAGALAAVMAVSVISASGYQTFAAEDGGKSDSGYDQNYADDDRLTVGYDDLSDVLQKGGLGVAEDQIEGEASLASAYDAAALEKRVVEGIRNWETEVDISDIGLTRDELIAGAVRDVINSHPEIIGLSGGYSYYYLGSNVTSLVFTYSELAKQDQQTLYEKLDALDNEIDTSGMTDEEIVLAYHEYLTSTVAYAYEAYLNGTLGSKHEYDMYGALVNHSAVCQGYAETMFYLLKKAGLSCAVASSSNINHAWNIVKLHGKWYHIDATWDDPVWDMPGRSKHDYFLVSFDTMNKNTLVNHTKDRTDMVVSAQWGDVYTSATDTTYESGKFWNGVNKAILYKDGYWYSIGSGASDIGYQINKYQYSTGTNKVIYSGTAKWTAPSGGYYSGVYGSIYLHGNDLYFTTPDSLKKIDLTVTTASPVEILNIRTKYNSASGSNLYAFGEQYGKVVYFISDTPNLKQTKDTSDSTKYNKNYEEYTLDICINHDWDAGVVTVEPTYYEEGEKLYTCTNCGATKTEKVDKLICTEHAWDDGVVTIEPTYESEGEKVYTCKNCGEVKTELVDKLVCTDHVWDDGVVAIQPTYESEGEKVYTCKNCGAVKTELVDKLVCTEHKWDAGVVVTAPTYTNTGTKKYTCENCGEIRTEIIGKLGCTDHAWDDGIVTVEPTYKTEGEKKYTCTNCGETKTEQVDKLVCTEHKWDAGVVTRKSTYTAEGIKTYTCTNCGETKTEKIAKLKLGKVTVKAAVTSTGIKLTWSEVKAADGYNIYRKNNKGTYTLLGKEAGAKSLTYTNTNLTSGTKYTYKVQAYKGNAVGETGAVSQYFVGTAKIKTANASIGMKLAWNKVGGAGTYKIYRKAGTGSYSCIKTVNASVVTYIDRSVQSGITYTYLVKPIVGSTAGTYNKSTRLYLRSVTAKVKVAKVGVTVSWTKCSGANEYRVYRKVAGGKYALVKKISGANTLTWNDKNASKGKTYYYYVRAFKGSSYSAASVTLKIKR